jgi:hypothetical protein
MKRYFLFILFVSITMNTFAQNQMYFSRKTLNINEVPGDIIELSDNNAIFVTGSYKTIIDSIHHPVLFKIRNKIIVDSLFLANEVGTFFTLTAINHNQIAVIGSLKNDSTGNYDLTFWLIDSNLHVLSTKKYSTYFLNFFYIFTTLTSQKKLAITFTGDSGTNDLGICYTLLDSLGNMVYNNKYLNYLNYGGADFGYNIIEQGKNTFLSFVVCPYFASQLGNGACVVKHDSLLNIINVDTIPPILCGFCNMMSAVSKNKNEFYLCGKHILQTNNHDYFRVGISLMDSTSHVEKTVLLGNLTDTINFPSANRSIDFIDYSNIFVGYTYNFQNDYPWSVQSSWVAVCDLDSMLNIKWRKYIGGDMFYATSSIRATSDGGCLVTGTFFGYDLSIKQHDMFILKLDSAGNVVSSIPGNLQIIDKALIYPNPGQNELNITLPENYTETVFELYNATGVLCRQTKFNTENQNINTTALSQGIYLYRILQNGKVISSGKWVKNE